MQISKIVSFAAEDIFVTDEFSVYNGAGLDNVNEGDMYTEYTVVFLDEAGNEHSGSLRVAARHFISEARFDKTARIEVQLPDMSTGDWLEVERPVLTDEQYEELKQTWLNCSAIAAEAEAMSAYD